MNDDKNVDVTIKIGDYEYKLVDFEDQEVGCEDCDIRSDFKAKDCEICFTLDLFERNAVFQRQQN